MSGSYGSGANIFRGHTNVQGATDLGLDVTTLPLYYGLSEDAWRHWCRVWEVDYDWMRPASPDKTLMETPGIPSTRWFDATLAAEGSGQPAGYFAGHVRHGARRQYHHADAGIGPGNREARTCWWSAIPIRPAWSVLSGRKNGTYLLPACTSFEMDGSRTASNRSLQWGEKIVEADLRIEERLRHDVHARAQARLCRPDVQEHQGREWRGVGGRYPARDQSRRLVHRLLRPIARAAQGAHEKPGQVRPGHAAGAQGRSRSRAAIITVCRGPAGEHRSSGILARRSSTTPICP